MNSVLRNALPLAALCLLSWSCDADLLIGEKMCHGEGVDCDSDAPTLDAFEQAGQLTAAVPFDVEVSRSVAPTWIYEHPGPAWRQVAPAPGGGVWVLYSSTTSIELLRLDEQGKPVESHLLDKVGTLFVDDEQRPSVLSAHDGVAMRASLDRLGNIVKWTLDRALPRHVRTLLVNGPEGRMRLGVFDEVNSYVAEYAPLGDVVWKQTELRNARTFPFENVGAGMVPVASYEMAPLSDGSLAVGVPKQGRSDRVRGLSLPERVQGITLIGPDGNVRWDMLLDAASFSMFLAPGLDGSVVYANGIAQGSSQTGVTGVVMVRVIEGDGTLAAGWMGRRTGYHDATPHALCVDAAGTIYTALLTGERDAPVSTVCRMSISEGEKVECVGIEGAQLPPGEGFGTPLIHSITAPEPDAVVLSIDHIAPDGKPSIERVLRIDF